MTEFFKRLAKFVTIVDQSVHFAREYSEMQ